MAYILKGITIDNSTTTGTVAAGDLTILTGGNSNYIFYGDDIFKLASKNSSTLVYTCLGINSGYFVVKAITITISTGAWALSSNTIAQYTLNGTNLDITTE